MLASTRSLPGATSPRLPTRVATVVMRLSARFSSAVATASGSTSSAVPRAAGHSSAAAIDRMPDPQPRSTNRVDLARRQLLGHRDHETGRGVAAGPERAPRIDVDHTVGRRRRRRVPARPDDEAASDPQRAEVSLPDVAPLVLVGLAARDRHRVGRHARGAQARAGGLDLGDDLLLDVGRALREDQRPPTLDPEDGLGVADLDPARQRADGVSEHLGRDRRNVDGELDPTRGHAPRPSPASADDAALRFATTALARLAHLAFALHRGLLVITAPLDLLQDPFLRHLLLQDLQRLVDGIPDFNFQRSAEQRLQKGLLGESGDLTLQT